MDNERTQRHFRPRPQGSGGVAAGGQPTTSSDENAAVPSTSYMYGTDNGGSSSGSLGGDHCVVDKRKPHDQRRCESDDHKRQDTSFMAAPVGGPTAAAAVLLDRNNLEGARELLDAVLRHPPLVHDPDLRFLKTFLLNFGCTRLPDDPAVKQRDEWNHQNHLQVRGTASEAYEGEYGESFSDDECEEDDYLEERIDEKLLAPENEPMPATGRDPSAEPSQQEIDLAAQHKAAASDAVSIGEYETAVSHFTEALLLVPSAMLYARRAEVLLLQKRPMASLRDCDIALKLNPDSARALKARGKVNRVLGEWETAFADLSRGLDIDYDDESADIHKECQEFVNQLEARRAARQQRQRERIVQAVQQQRHEGASPYGLDSNTMQGMMNDPEMVAAMHSPKVKAAMIEVMRDPSTSMKYVLDPEVGPIIMKLIATVTAKQSPSNSG